VSPDFADDPSFDLAWPRELFVTAAAALLSGFYLASSIELLLTEAFRSERASQRHASQQRALLVEGPS
jgi:hypothetical protein